MNGIVGGGDRNAQRAAQGAVQRISRAVVVTRSFLEFVATLLSKSRWGRRTRRVRVGIKEKEQKSMQSGTFGWRSPRRGEKGELPGQSDCRMVIVGWYTVVVVRLCWTGSKELE